MTEMAAQNDGIMGSFMGEILPPVQGD